VRWTKASGERARERERRWLDLADEFSVTKAGGSLRCCCNTKHDLLIWSDDAGANEVLCCEREAKSLVCGERDGAWQGEVARVQLWLALADEICVILRSESVEGKARQCSFWADIVFFWAEFCLKLSKRRHNLKLKNLPAQCKNCFWCFKVFFEATWRMSNVLSVVLVPLSLLLLFLFLLTYAVLL
jgi:hypothetical protein